MSVCDNFVGQLALNVNDVGVDTCFFYSKVGVAGVVALAPVKQGGRLGASVDEVW
jgi:hypothetical protein